MINKYTIHNFKNHANTELKLGPLNILTGVNGMGKSSVLQSMLVLRDSYNKRPQMSALTLDGDSFSIDSVIDLVNCNMHTEQNILQLTMEIDTSTHPLNFRYKYPIGETNELSFDEHFLPPSEDYLKGISLFNDNFQYLSAFRTGPRLVYPSNINIVEKHRQISHLMGMGEYAAYFLTKYGSDEIPIKELSYNNEERTDLVYQVEKWMGEVSNGIRIQINQEGKNIKLGFGYEVPGKKTIYHSSMNTGYGVSYILSVIVAILSAKPDSLILIENPEAHIHPSGQAALMRMITIAAHHGVQFIIETHSDHIINGALVNAKIGNIIKDSINIYYFERDEQLNAAARKINIEDNGRIQHAPIGFFDQMDADTEVLFDIF